MGEHNRFGDEEAQPNAVGPASRASHQRLEEGRLRVHGNRLTSVVNGQPHTRTGVTRVEGDWTAVTMLDRIAHEIRNQLRKAIRVPLALHVAAEVALNDGSFLPRLDLQRDLIAPCVARYSGSVRRLATAARPWMTPTAPLLP